jgi:hypothetical protein
MRGSRIAASQPGASSLRASTQARTRGVIRMSASRAITVAAPMRWVASGEGLLQQALKSSRIYDFRAGLGPHAGAQDGRRHLGRRIEGAGGDA